MSQQIPSHLLHVGVIMSNSDHLIDREVAGEMLTGPYVAKYRARRFTGKVWFDPYKRLWHCAISRWWRYRETITSGTLDGIMEQACQKYGDR